MSTVTRSTEPSRTSSFSCLSPARVATRRSCPLVRRRSNTNLAKHRIPFPHISATSPFAL